MSDFDDIQPATEADDEGRIRPERPGRVEFTHPDDQPAPMIRGANEPRNQLDDALSTYKKAVDAGTNDAITPYYLKKYGMLSEKLGKYGQAKEAYERIKRDFPSSPVATDIEKYIIRAGARG